MPGLPFPVRVPVAHMDRPPEGIEAELFTYKPASVYDEHWVAIDIPQAKKLATRFLNAFNSARGAPWLELP